MRHRNRRAARTTLVLASAALATVAIAPTADAWTVTHTIAEATVTLSAEETQQAYTEDISYFREICRDDTPWEIDTPLTFVWCYQRVAECVAITAPVYAATTVTFTWSETVCEGSYPNQPGAAAAPPGR